MVSVPKTPAIADAERTPQITALLEIIQCLREQVQALKDEIARLKGEQPRPTITPSTLEAGPRSQATEGNDKGKRPGSAKRRKRDALRSTRR